MSSIEDQIKQFKQTYNNAIFEQTEGGVVYYLISEFDLGVNCSPRIVDLLLCPTPRDNYPSRLFFSEKFTIKNPLHTKQNWNKSEMIVDRVWHAQSWKAETKELSLLQIFQNHLEVTKCKA